jgi:hypothetical protein
VPGNLASSARTVSVVYQNTSAFPIYVTTYVVCSGTNNLVQAFSDSSSTPTTPVFSATTSSSGSSDNNGSPATFFVMPGDYYEVVAASFSSLQIWREFVCQTGTITDSGDLGPAGANTRGLTTIYQNTTSKTLFVIAQFNTVTNGAVLSAISDASSTPSDVVDTQTDGTFVSGDATAFFLVPPGDYYQITLASGTGALSYWHEYAWDIACTKSPNLLLTSGQGQTRTVYANSQTVNSGSGVAFPVTFQSWFADPQKVRWLSVMSSCAELPNSCGLWADSSIPPSRGLTYFQNSTSGFLRPLRGPVMPGSNSYGFTDTTTEGTLTGAGWFEYTIG